LTGDKPLRMTQQEKKHLRGLLIVAALIMVLVLVFVKTVGVF